jgi:hypothetical protein
MIAAALHGIHIWRNECFEHYPMRPVYRGTCVDLPRVISQIITGCALRAGDGG